jgi:mannitol 2-dehydrogenase
MATRLCQKALDQLGADVAVPAYDRTQLTAGVLHVGLGNFHRAHQAVYLDELFAQGGDPSWGIVGASVMPGDAAMRDDLVAQDWLYSVTEEDAHGQQVRIVGSLTDFLPVEAGHGPIRRAMADPAIRIVSLTVTEGGYYTDPSKGGFDAGHPDIRADIAHPDEPTTVFGAIVAGLRARRRAGQAPFTVMSCDNIPHNGAMTREVVTGVAKGQDSDLAAWISDQVAFPNGMVDRITPATSAARRERLEQDHGFTDARPVFCEPFRQWVLEDNFPEGRPALERVGVQFVADVAPYEALKLRVLNGGHATIAYAAGLLDIEYVHDAMADERVAGFLDSMARHEVLPVVPALPDMSPADYLATCQERFANPCLGDTVRRLCHDGSGRQPKFIVPTIQENLAAGRSIEGLALESALWCRYCAGTTDSGAAVEPNDPRWQHLNERALAARADPSSWLAMSDIYGDVGVDERFAMAFGRWLDQLWRDGTDRTLRRYLDGP